MRRERINFASGIENTDSIQYVFFEWTGLEERERRKTKTKTPPTNLLSFP